MRASLCAFLRSGLCLLVLAAGARAQQPAPDLLANARKVYAEQGAKPALAEFDKALAAFRAANDRHGEAITLGLIGNCYKHLGDSARALQFLQQALAMKRELGDRAEEGRTLGHLGLLYWDMGDYPKAIESHEASLGIARELHDQQMEGSELNNLGLVYDEIGDYQRSLEVYEQALAIHRKAKFERGEGDTLANIGGVYLLRGRYREALEKYQEALAIRQRLGLNPSSSQDLGNIAFCYGGLGKPEEAIANFDRAMDIARAAGLAKEEAELHKGKGSALLQMSKFNAALDEYAAALAIYDRAGLKQEKIELLNDRGELYLSLGDLDTGERDFSSAIALARSIGSPRGIASNAVALGDLEARRHRPERAAKWYQEALSQNIARQDLALRIEALLHWAAIMRDQDLQAAYTKADEALTTAQSTGSARLEGEALLVVGDMLRRQSKLPSSLEMLTRGETLAGTNPELGWQLDFARGRTLEALNRTDDAIADYRHAVEIIESVYSELRQERYRAGYLQDKSELYAALVRLLLKQGHTDEAFLFSERLRVRAQSVSSSPRPTEQESERMRELRARIRHLQDALDKEAAKGATERQNATRIFSADLRDAQREYENLRDDATAGAAPAASVTSARQIQGLLAPDEALLEYVVGEQSLSAFLITSGTLRASTVAVSAEQLETNVELLRDLISRKTSSDWEKPAANLARQLLVPVMGRESFRGLRRLTIVSNGVLHYVPFAVLPEVWADSTRPLIADYVVDYLPSASALAAGPRDAADKGVLAMAPTAAHLRYAADEASRVGKAFPANAMTLIGAKATESSFKELSSQYEIIHFATHGYFNSFNPLFSRVQLQPDARDDGRLNVYEILDLRLHARLVTLSACDTALGSGYFSDLPPGDDFVGLAEAFLSAGSSSVLATLWSVNDRSTLQLMTGFYRRLATVSSASALALAQRQMLATHEYHHPYYWAPFVLLEGNRQAGEVFSRKTAAPVRTTRAIPPIGVTNRSR